MKRVRVWGLLALGLCASLCWADAVRADEPAEDPGESRAATFQAMEGARGEQVPGGPLLVSAYGVVMVLLVGYVARLSLMQRKTESEVERLSAAIQRARAPGK